MDKELLLLVRGFCTYHPQYLLLAQEDFEHILLRQGHDEADDQRRQVVIKATVRVLYQTSQQNTDGSCSLIGWRCAVLEEMLLHSMN